MVCLDLSKKLLGNGAKLPPKDLVHNGSLIGKYRNALRMISLLEQQKVELLEELQSANENNDKLSAENMYSSETIIKLVA